uniref:Uncharacterized protein n=1 Tax=Steinernema glaseri TaxID=37863 RepID=A0A1I7Y8Y8_9BILA
MTQWARSSRATLPSLTKRELCSKASHIKDLLPTGLPQPLASTAKKGYFTSKLMIAARARNFAGRFHYSL